MLLFIILLIILNISLLFFIFKKDYNIHTINKSIDEENERIEKRNQELTEEKKQIIALIELSKTHLTEAQNAAEAVKASFQAMEESYAETLDKSYTEKEKEIDNQIMMLEKYYNEKQDEYIAETASIKSDLDKIASTRAAAIQAQIKEKEIKEDLSFYCLQVSENDKDDIHTLERIKPNLHQPRILCMLIWSTYFQKPMTALCNNILGTAIVSGIYKITNQETGECYIGQAVDIAKRWKDHAKCGLGIDTPANNKLYKAIQEFGIWHFSWELLEKCPKEQLNEKEAFYIDLYDSKNYGYNSSLGIKNS